VQRLPERESDREDSRKAEQQQTDSERDAGGATATRPAPL
jgi:hypothetical protein